MARFELVFKRSVAKDLRSMLKQDVARILQRLDALRENPRGQGCVKLSAMERYRVRQGAYRIVYEIVDSKLIVVVVKVAHHSVVYKTR